jgi:acetylglutamate kinase
VAAGRSSYPTGVITPKDKGHGPDLKPPPASPGTIVRKYGGSSLPSVARIRAIATELARLRREGHRLVVVVSAMGSTTDELVNLAHQANPQPPRRELDMLISVGERITMSLLSMALAAEDCPAISYTGSQCGIVTDSSHTNARIIEVRADRVRKSLADGYVVVVAGFQGVSQEKEITTLGRGGSDTTAVALAAALAAERCEILKDVAGVLTIDPHELSAAMCHPFLSYRQLRDAAANGCGVIHLRAVEYAERHRVPLFIGSSFQPGQGTLVTAAGAHRSEPGRPDALEYRPVTMIVRRRIAWLEWQVERPEAAQMWLARRSEMHREEIFLTEWLQMQNGLQWGAVGTPEALAPLHAQLERHAARQGGRVLFRDADDCLILAGGEPALRPNLAGRVSDLLARLDAPDWRLRIDSAALRLLVRSGCLDPLLKSLHAAFFPA